MPKMEFDIPTQSWLEKWIKRLFTLLLIEKKIYLKNNYLNFVKVDKM